MSSFYVGPFGRFLPTFKHLQNLSECTRGEAPDPYPNGSSPRQLWPSERHVTLEFGTDNTLGSPTRTAMLSPDPPSRAKEDEPCILELLPSERQLLTPSSPSDSPSSTQASQARLKYSASPSITSAQLFSPVDGTVSETQVLPVHISQEFTEDTGLTAAATVTTEQVSHPISSLCEQYYSDVEGDGPTICIDFQNPLSQAARPFTPPEMDYPITHYHQGQLPYHPNLPSAESPPSSDPVSANDDSLPQPPHPLLPHVIDEQVIEGEGLCYLYSDGSYCPKTIDGEPVNASWGVTKAGKPRKRLAQACITCREKKIKCRPNLPKCDQSQKSGRSCRFMSAPRGNKPCSKKPQALRKVQATGSKDGFAANSPDLQYPLRLNIEISSIYNTNTSSYPGELSPSQSPGSLSPISGRSLSLYSRPTDETLLPQNHFPELGRSPKRRK